jgi:transcriptional regulator of acetoin/glycerol metabolism
MIFRRRRQLIDSELFGYEKGVFTGATTDKSGRFERTSGGTIFFDEIGELPQKAQVRLLRVLQHHEIERVGGNKPIPVDIRVIAATHRNLERMVSENQFREDLWFRLNVYPIIIPPLPAIAPGALQRLIEYNSSSWELLSRLGHIPHWIKALLYLYSRHSNKISFSVRRLELSALLSALTLCDIAVRA